MGACDHLRHTLITAPPEPPQPPLRSSFCCSSPTPTFSRRLTAVCETNWLCSHFRGQGAAHLALDQEAHCQAQGSGACPGGSEVMLLSSSLLCSHSCQCGLQVLFLSGSLPGLVSPLLSSSGALLLPYQALWGKLTGCAWQGSLRGACIGAGSLQLAPSECPVSLRGLPPCPYCFLAQAQQVA